MNAHWSWSLTREGSVVDESHERIWSEKANGTRILPLTLSGKTGIYDLGLYLNAKLPQPTRPRSACFNPTIVMGQTGGEWTFSGP